MTTLPFPFASQALVHQGDVLKNHPFYRRASAGADRVGANGGVDLALWNVYSLISLAGTGLGAYHGYRRNDSSVGWAVIWGLLGGAFPIITIPVAFAQGFGKRGPR